MYLRFTRILVRITINNSDLKQTTNKQKLKTTQQQQTNNQTNNQTNKQANKQANKQTNKATPKLSPTYNTNKED